MVLCIVVTLTIQPYTSSQSAGLENNLDSLALQPLTVLSLAGCPIAVSYSCTFANSNIENLKSLGGVNNVMMADSISQDTTVQ